MVAGAIAAALAIALIIGFQLRDHGETTVAPSASSSPRTTSLPNVDPRASASSTDGCGLPNTSCGATGPTAAVVLNDSFGLIVQNSGVPAIVRSETGADVATINGTLLVPSPNGDRVAYVVFQSTGPVIHVRTIAGGADRTVVTFAAGDNVTGLAWSTDGTGLLVPVGSAGDVGPGSPTATLNAIDLAGGAPTLIATRSDGKIYHPITWDRAGKLVAAATTGAGGGATAYITVDLSRSPFVVTSVPIAGRAALPTASTDGKYVLATDFTDLSIVRWWPIADYGSAEIVKAQSAPPTGGARWRPGTSTFGFVSGAQLDLYDVARRSFAQPVLVPLGSHIAGFRVDGSAAIIALQSAGDATVIDLATGRSAAVTARGGLGPSVRLR